MKTVLLFGDSNTWGYEPGTGDRFTRDVRWPGVVRAQLGDQVEIIEEALSGRTTCYDDPIWPNRNGLSVLPLVLESHSPLDLVVIMLGSNDLKERFNLSAHSIALGAAKLVETCLGFDPPVSQVLLVSPVVLESFDDPEMDSEFKGAASKSKELSTHYRFYADRLGVSFFDAALVAQRSDIDGLHLEPENHQKLGNAITERVASLLDIGYNQ